MIAMQSEKLRKQLLYRDIYEEIESFDTYKKTGEDVQQLIHKICKLDKTNKKKVLLKKLQNKKNFLVEFNNVLEKDLRKLMKQ